MKNKPSTRWLYLPIDVKVREMESKTWLALNAAKRGYNVVIGQKKNFPSILSCYPPGFYVGFAAMENFEQDYKKFRKKNHKIILMDEEGLVTHNEEIYVRNRLDKNILNLCAVFIAWGQKQTEILDRYRIISKNKICLAGNPRFDILKPEFKLLYEEDVNRIKNKYGKFILINSNFGSCNHFLGGDIYLQSLQDKKIIQSEEDFSFFKRYFAYRKKIMDEIIKSIPALRQNFPDYAIVIRPHPSEKKDVWIKETNHLKNIHVIHEGSALPWIIACDVLIHNFCTTALEAFALKRTPIAYRPYIDESLETALPSLVSLQAFNESELIETVNSVLKGITDPDRIKKEKYMVEFIANFEEKTASGHILDQLDEIELKTSYFSNSYFLKHKIRKTLEKIKKFFKGADNNNYQHHKFESLETSEIITMAKKIEKTSGELSSFFMKKIHKNCVFIKGQNF